MRRYGLNETDFSNGCLKPVHITLKGLASAIRVSLLKETTYPAHHDIRVPCRKCDICLSNRSKRWAAKARTEVLVANRTWFGTFTIKPSQRFLYKLEAQHTALLRGCDWSGLTVTEQFAYIVGQISPDLTKFIKRIRKNSGAKLRYLLVAEAHKDGFPHFHILLHEIGEQQVSKSILQHHWKHGFSSWKLVDDEGSAPWYVCKYMAKTALIRVRASQNYGPFAERSFTEHALGVTQSLLKKGLIQAKLDHNACQ